MLDALRADTLQKLQQTHRVTALDMVYTTDHMWGAPAGQSATDFASAGKNQ